MCPRCSSTSQPASRSFVMYVPACAAPAAPASWRRQHPAAPSTAPWPAPACWRTCLPRSPAIPSRSFASPRSTRGKASIWIARHWPSGSARAALARSSRRSYRSRCGHRPARRRTQGSGPTFATTARPVQPTLRLVKIWRRYVLSADKLHGDGTPVPMLSPGLWLKTSLGKLSRKSDTSAAIH